MIILVTATVTPTILSNSNADIMALEFEERPDAIAFDPTKGLIYIGLSDSLKVIEADTFKVIKSLSFGFSFYDLAVSSKADHLYVSHLVPVNQTGFSAEYRISILNGTTHDVLKSIAIGGQNEGPVTFGLDEESDTLYFRKGFEPTVYALDGTSGTISRAFDFEKETVFAIDTSRDLMYTASYDPDGPIVVSVVRSASLEKMARDFVLDAPIGSYTIPIVIDASKQLLYVPVLNKSSGYELSIPTGAIYVFDISSDSLVLKKKIEMQTPTRLIVDPQNNVFYILDVEAGLYSYDSETYARRLITDGGRLLGEYAFDDTTGALYLLDKTTNTLHAYSREQVLGLYWTGESLQHVDEPSVYSMSGEKLKKIQVGQTGAITITVHNPEDRPLEALLLLEVRDGNGITMFLASQRTTIPGIRDYTMHTSWTPDRLCWVSSAGCENYLIRTFALSLTEEPTAHFDYVRKSELLVVR